LTSLRGGDYDFAVESRESLLGVSRPNPDADIP